CDASQVDATELRGLVHHAASPASSWTRWMPQTLRDGRGFRPHGTFPSRPEQVSCPAGEAGGAGQFPRRR
ncbi:hypothetical protein, partial [Streptomyces bicolor]|uniref:hypothetical protein n=1 Tax=Streptomyces bicolor TaxID=66874 RepID=UPI00055EA9D0